MPNLFDEKYKLSHRLEGVINGMGQEIAAMLDGALEKVTGKIAALSAKAEETKSLTRKKRLLLRQKAEIKKILDEIYRDIVKQIKDKSTELAKEAPEIANTILEKSAGRIQINFGLPKISKEQVLSWFDSTQIQGAFFADYLKTLEENAAKRIIQETRESMILNESYRETAKRIQKALDVGRRSAETLSRDAVFSAYNWGERQYQLKNKNQIKWLQWHSEIDRRTCPRCIPLDLRLFRPEECPLAPIHHNCRCMTFEVFKDKALEGAVKAKRIGRLETEARKIRHRDGTTSTAYRKLTVRHIPEDMTHSQWIKSMVISDDPRDRAFAREALGKTRFDLVANGKLEVERLYYHGKRRTINELKELSK